MTQDPQGWFPVGSRLDRPHSPDGWHPPRPAEDEPIDGPMPPRGTGPGYGTHAHIPRGRRMNAREATRKAETAADELRVAVQAIETAIGVAQEQKSSIEAAAGVICENELLSAAMQINSVIGELERAQTHLVAAIEIIGDAIG